MTQLSDGLRTGNVGLGNETGGAVRIINQLPGVANSPVFVYDIVPTQLLNNNIAAAQTVSGALFTISGSTGTTTTTINGVNYIDLGVARSVTASGASSGTTAVDISVTGLDTYLQPMSQTFSGPTASALTQTTKTFRYVRAVAASGNTVSGVSIGTGDVYGMPYRVDAFGYVVFNWNNTVITAATGFTAASAATATLYTGDVRGAYTVQSASDGTKRLTAFIFVKNPDTVAGAYGVTQA